MIPTLSVAWTPEQLRGLIPITGRTGVRPVDSIVIHHTGGGAGETPQGIHDYHASLGWGGCGYHFLVTPQLTVWRGRPLWARGAHCKANNSGRIGIALLGNYSTQAPEPRMVTLALALIEDLRSLYGPLQVYPHYSVPGSSTNCPGAALVRLFAAKGLRWGAM